MVTSTVSTGISGNIRIFKVTTLSQPVELINVSIKVAGEVTSSGIVSPSHTNGTPKHVVVSMVFISISGNTVNSRTIKLSQPLILVLVTVTVVSFAG